MLICWHSWYDCAMTFFSRDWIVRVTHVYRKTNRLAEGLANYVFSLHLGFHSFDSCPSVVHSIMLVDAVGTECPHHVRL